MQIRSRMCAREFKSDDRPDLYAGTLPLEALKAIISTAANSKETFSIMHIDVPRAYFYAKAQRPVLIRLPVEGRMGTDAGKVGRTQPAIGNAIGKNTLRIGDFNWDSAQSTLFHHKEDRVSGLTHGDDFVLTGPTKKLMEFEEDDECVPHQSEDHHTR